MSFGAYLTVLSFYPSSFPCFRFRDYLLTAEHCASKETCWGPILREDVDNTQVSSKSASDHLFSRWKDHGKFDEGHLRYKSISWPKLGSQCIGSQLR